MINIFLFLALIFIFTFLIGRIIEKVRVPWIFAALILGAFLAIHNPFADVTSSKTFEFLAQLGMYFLLFVIGLEIDLNKLKKKTRFIFKATFFIVLFEAIFGTMLVHFVFHYPWLIAFAVALSFATVGEAILAPILHEFNIVNTPLGQAIIGIGTLDDLIEIFALILVVVIVGSSIHTGINIALMLASLAILFGLTFSLTKLKEEGKKFGFLKIEILFLFSLFILFLFLGIGEYAHAAPMAALLSGIAIKTFVPEKRFKRIESEIKTMCYGFFAPLFFVWAGVTMNMRYLITYPLLILLVLVVSNGAKLLASWIVGRKEFGFKQSILLGIGLSVRFSISIVIVKLLLENGMIGSDLYSIILASSIVFQFAIPLMFSYLLVRWKIARQQEI